MLCVAVLTETNSSPLYEESRIAGDERNLSLAFVVSLFFSFLRPKEGDNKSENTGKEKLHCIRAEKSQGEVKKAVRAEEGAQKQTPTNQKRVLYAGT